MYNPLKELGYTLQKLRENRALSLAELAQRIGYNYVHVSYVEKGLRTPSEEYIEKVTDALCTDPEERDAVKIKLLQLLYLSRAPQTLPASEIITGSRPTMSMPYDFLLELEQELRGKRKKLPAHIVKLMEMAVTRKMLLSRSEVIEIAKSLGKDQYEFMVKAGYIPREFEKTITRQSVIALIRCLSEITPEDADRLSSLVQGIIETYKSSLKKGLTKNKRK